jgi:3'(2'), 5'-bisphosphate nucleotidase
MHNDCLPMHDLQALSDVELARELARRSGEHLRALRERGEHIGKALGDAADREANELILSALRTARPNDAILSEESIDDLARLDAVRVWIVDPLDGTREYREGRGDWAVHIALVEAGCVIAAAVTVPASNEMFSTDAPTLSRTSAERRVVISRSRPPEFAKRVADALNAELVQVGSAGAKAMMVVRGDAVAYVHDGGMNEWDAAAPVGVALAHGLHVSDLRGNRFTFNRRDVVLREGLVICASESARAALQAISNR